MEYNSNRSLLKIKEYGRHVQNMVESLLKIEDKQKRQEQAEIVIELMGQLNPAIKLADDFKQKLWDHLFIISNFNLDIDSPYPIPNKETIYKKPTPLPYPNQKLKYRHLGKNLEILIEQALAEEDTDKKNNYAHIIAYSMKLVYSNYHKELVHDDTIRGELKNITGGQLEFSNTPYVHHRNNIERVDFRPNNKWNNNRNRNNGKNNDRFGKPRNDKRNNNYKNRYF